MYVIKKVYIYL